MSLETLPKKAETKSILSEQDKCGLGVVLLAVVDAWRGFTTQSELPYLGSVHLSSA